MDRKREHREKRKQGVFMKGLDSEVAEIGTKMDHCTSINTMHMDLNLGKSDRLLIDSEGVLIENVFYLCRSETVSFLKNI